MAQISKDHDVKMLVGRLLTYIDATYTDKEQREAQKSLVRVLVYEWYNQIAREQDPDIPQGIPNTDKVGPKVN